jgi:hypothetical protein
MTFNATIILIIEPIAKLPVCDNIAKSNITS